MRLIAPILLVLLFPPCVSVLAAHAPSCRGVAVFDFRRAEGTEEKNRAFFFPEQADHATAMARDVFKHAYAVVQLAAVGQVTLDETNALLADIDGGAAADAARERVITLKGDVICNVAIFDSRDQRPTISSTETARTTRFQQDLSTLKKVLPQSTGPEAPPTIEAVATSYRLLKTRATLAVQAKQATTAPEGEDDKPVVGEQKETTLTVSFITGPGEHLFIALDVPLSKVKDLKIDPAAQSVEVKEKPANYYGSLSWQLGDLFSEFPTRYASNIVVKAFFNLSKDPRSSYGGGIGYRLPAMNRYGLELKDVSPFIGYFRSTTTTTIDGVTSDMQESSWRWGVSLNLDKALSWATQ